MEALVLKSKLILHVFFSKHDRVLVAKLFFNSIKCKLSKKNMRFVKISWYDIICRDCGNKLRRFRVIYHVHCLETVGSPEKFLRVEKDSVRFWSNNDDQIWVWLWNIDCSQWNFDEFSNPFDNFNSFTVTSWFKLKF